MRRYHDVASDVSDLQGQRQHVQVAHHLQDQLGVRPRQLQQAKQVEGVTGTQTQTHFYNKPKCILGDKRASVVL